MINCPATPKNVTTLDFDKITAFPNNRIQISENDRQFDIEQEFINRVETVSGDQDRLLIRYCENLSTSLRRTFMIATDPLGIRQSICQELSEKLDCSDKQAQCLIELTLELIHIKVHGSYRQSRNVELGYMITMAANALRIYKQ